MNKKFLSVILFSALMVGTAGTFTSCKDYDDDIDQINKELTDIKSQIEALENKINEGKWITSVTPSTDGLTITLSDGQTYNITNGKNGQDGAAGAAGTEWTISEDGYWVCNGEKTDVKAVGKDGEKGENGEDGQQEVKFENGKWLLWNGTEFVEFKGAAATTENVPYYYTDPDDQNYAILVVFDENGQNKKEIRLPLNEGLAQISIVSNKGLKVYYSIATSNKALQAWEGPKGAPAKGSYMITYSDDSLMVQVTPNNFDLAKTELQLVNSKNEVAPVTLGAPVAYNGLYTRAVSANGLFQIPFSIEKITDEIVEAYPNEVDKKPALALVANDKVRSMYENTLVVEKAVRNTDFGFFYVSKKDIDGGYSFYIEPGKSATLKAVSNADQLYDAYLTVDEYSKADSIKYGIKTDGLTISCSEAAKGNLTFNVHTLDVAGNVTHSQYYVSVTFDQEMTEKAYEFETQEHITTGVIANQKLLVDFAPYFKDMTEADRILWNADTYMSYSGGVDWVYTDEATGREVTVENKRGLIQEIQMATADGVVVTDNKDFAKLLITFNTDYSNFKFTGVYTAKVTFYNYDANTKEVVSIPFELANPTDEEIAQQYSYNPAYYDATAKVFTIPSATSVDLQTLITSNYVSYSDITVNEEELRVSGSVVTMVDATDLNTVYTVDGLKLDYLGNTFDIPAIKVKFIEFKNYKFATANTLSLQSGKVENAVIKYGKPATTSDKAAYYSFKTLLNADVAATNVTNVRCEFTSPVATDGSGNLISDVTVDGDNNITVNFTGKKTTVDTSVAIKVIATVSVDGVTEEVEGTITVNIKKYPTE